MTLRCLSGLALCLGLAGCTRLSPAYSEASTDSGVDGPTVTTTEPQTSDTRGSSSSPKETDSIGTGDDESSSGSESSTGLRPDPDKCQPDAACGAGLAPCPPGSACNVYIDEEINVPVAGCFPIGQAAWGAPCEPTCDGELRRCKEGLVCASWRRDPICLNRCGPEGECDLVESCIVPAEVEPSDGGCEPPVSCDLLEQDCTSPGHACVPAAGGSSACVPFPNSGGGAGETCGALNGCAPGLICTEGPMCLGNDGCCMPLCDLDADFPICVCDGLQIPDQPSVGVCTTFPA